MVFLPLFFTFSVVTISFYLWNWSYWRRRGIPGPPAIPVFGNKLSLMSESEPYPVVLHEWRKKYGRTYGIQEGIHQILVTSDPIVIQEVFQKQFENFHERKLLTPINPKNPRINMLMASGHRWKRLRTISSPSFTSGNLKKLHPTIENSVLELMSYMENHSGGSIDFEEYFQQYTMDVIGRVALGQTESVMFNNPMPKVITSRVNFISTLAGVLGSVLPESIAKYVNVSFLAKFSKKKHPFQIIEEACEKSVYDRIKQREKDLAAGIEPGDPVDFIDLFLDAKSDELFDEEDYNKGNIKVSRRLTTDEIIAQCMVFLIAGFDTTSISLSFATNLLATHPEVQKKVQEEIDRECPNPSVDAESLGRLHYIDAVIKETLRLYPLASLVNSRKCVNSTVCGDVFIEKGTYVQADTWSLHYDKELWGENAEEFVPERLESQNLDGTRIFRWLEGDVNKNNWIPFGHGPRQCIGMRLSIMEQRLLFAHLLRKYTIVPGPRTKELQVRGVGIFRPQYTIFNVVERN